jgi:predicted permease
MAIIGEWIRRLGYVLRRGRHEDELRREMEAHRALMDEPRDFGNTLRLREEAREAWGWTWLDDLAHDTRFALRTFRRSPGFALTAVLTLALGVGVNIGMFTLVNGLLLRPLYERPDEVVAVSNRGTGASEGYRGISYPNYRDLLEGTTGVFADLAAFTVGFRGVDDGDGASRTLASAVTANYFKTLDVPLALGRVFTPEEERLGAGIRVAIVSYSFWERRGGDSNIIGRIVRVDGEQFTIVGVAPKGFTGASIPGPEVWVPLGAEGAQWLGARDTHILSVVGRLQPGIAAGSAAPAVATVARRLQQAFPDVNAGYTLEVSAPWRLLFMPGPGSAARTAALAGLLMIMPAIVLLVACLNLVDLLLARGHVRRQEIAVRSSLGGGRGRLVRQLMSEGLLLAVAGSAVGLLLSMWATNALVATLDPVLPVSVMLPDFGLDWRVLIGGVGFSVIATLVFSAWPAWALTRRAAVTDLKRNIGQEGRRLGGLRMGNVLVIGQVALSLLLVASGGLFLMSALSAATADPGFRLDGGLIVEVDPGLAGYGDERGRQSHLALVDRLRTVPGVDAVSIGSRPPFSGGASRHVAPAGAADPQTIAVDAAFSVVGRDYARTLGLPMLGGRDFTQSELTPGSSEPVAIIDDALAERLWPGETALGRTIQFLDAPEPEANRPEPGRGEMRVVGIMPAVKHSLGNPQPFPHVYVPLGQHYEDAMTLQLRLADPAAERRMLATVARVARSVDERLPILRVETWRDHLDGSIEIWMYRAGARMFSAFAAIALLLAIVGVYGVKSYVVSRRTREFGIRIATGADPRALLWQVLREGGRVTAIGIGVGLLLALAAGRFLQGLLYGVDAVEPVVLVVAPLILVAASLLASSVPALRATKVDPTVALRSE